MRLHQGEPGGPSHTVQLFSAGTPVGADEKKVANFFVMRLLREPGVRTIPFSSSQLAHQSRADDNKVANFFLTRSLRALIKLSVTINAEWSEYGSADLSSKGHVGYKYTIS